jgi:hypothetical protein
MAPTKLYFSNFEIFSIFINALVEKRISLAFYELKVHKIEIFFDSDFGICVISFLVWSKW